MRKRKKKWLLMALLAVLLCLGFTYYAYQKIYQSNTNFEEKNKIVFVREKMSIENWLNLPENQDIFKNNELLISTAKLKKLKEIVPGRYKIPKGTNNNAVVNMLRNGNQEPLTIRTDNVTTLELLAGRLGKNLLSDSLSFIKAFNNHDLVASFGFNTTTIACMLMPNTYEFYWTISPEEFLKKMNGFYKGYWTNENLNKAKGLNLTQTDVTILASIVKAETATTTEAPKIAGLYLNRLRIDMPLQSDPTAVFGAGLGHVQRVTNEITHISAYNTYHNKGLPPGPINFPEKVYLDAVLNPEKHLFLYMCAQPGNTGIHNFARTFEQHQVFAAQYHKWLNQNGIR